MILQAMRPTEYLWPLAADDWQAATWHGFTDAVADGSLPVEKMFGYLQQDYVFIHGFVRLLASAIATAPTLPDAIPAAQFLGLIMGPENTYFLRSIEELGGRVEPPSETQAVTRVFQIIMRQAVQSGQYEQMLAVLLVAEWSYLDWASPHVASEQGLPFWFCDWITLHSGDEFEGVVAYLRGQLDLIWVDLSDQQRHAVEVTFCKTVALERQFFDAAWQGFPCR
jgi:thiaminase (transcriptional activator TenA)